MEVKYIETFMKAMVDTLWQIDGQLQINPTQSCFDSTTADANVKGRTCHPHILC